jgi:hypothetical protein
MLPKQQRICMLKIVKPCCWVSSPDTKGLPPPLAGPTAADCAAVGACMALHGEGSLAPHVLAT